MVLKGGFLVLLVIVSLALFIASITILELELAKKEKRKEIVIGSSLILVASFFAYLALLTIPTFKLKILEFFWKSTIAPKITSVVILIFFWVFNFFLLYGSIIRSLIIGNEINLPNWIFDKNKYEKSIEEAKENGLIFSSWNEQKDSIAAFIITLLFTPFMICLLTLYYLLGVKRIKSFRKVNKRIKFFFGLNKRYDKYIYCFQTFEYLYFILSLAGIILAIGYAKSGALLSLIATVEQKVNEKIKDYLKSKQKEKDDCKYLDKLETGLNLEESLELKKETNRINEESLESEKETNEINEESLELEKETNEERLKRFLINLQKQVNQLKVHSHTEPPDVL